MRIGIMGLKGDPPHWMHMLVAELARVQHSLDRVYIMLAGQPVDKKAEEVTPREIRWEMLLATLDNDPYLIPSRIELDREGPSYMVDTLRELQKTHSSADDEFFLILGEDRAPTLKGWREPEEIIKLASVLVAPRASAGVSKEWLAEVLPAGTRFDVIELDSSSTFVRTQIGMGRSVRWLINPATQQVIDKHGLYRPKPAAETPPPAPTETEPTAPPAPSVVPDAAAAGTEDVGPVQPATAAETAEIPADPAAAAAADTGTESSAAPLTVAADAPTSAGVASGGTPTQPPAAPQMVTTATSTSAGAAVAAAELTTEVVSNRSCHMRKSILDYIKSILDNDLYKFSMANAVLRKHPNVRVSYRFTDRKAKGRWTKEAVEELQRLIQEMSQLALTAEERAWCEKNMPWINRGFWDFLANYRFDPKEVRVWLDAKNNLQLEVKGLWCRTIFWEVPLMALICAVWYEKIDTNWNEDGQDEKMEDKAKRLSAAGVLWGDFGTRRRRHFMAQERVVLVGKKYSNFTGTSNVYLAMKHGVKALGTMAHEWIMAHSAIFSLKHANRYALQSWNDVYQGNLGTALPDTFGTDAFLRDFDGVLARLFDSVRHDSGDPYEWAEKMIAHYGKLGIDWRTKPLGFTDGNTADSAIEIHNWVSAKGGRCWFGIGTSLSNDYGPESPALSIVIKLYSVEDVDGTIIYVVKLSDNADKASGEADAVRVAKYTHLGTPLDPPAVTAPVPTAPTATAAA